MQTYHEFDHDGKHYRLVYDEAYTPVSSGDPEFGEQDLREEIDKLETGEWVALGCIVTQPCSSKEHCSSCNGWTELDSLWGIVVDNDIEEAVKTAKDLL